MDSFRILRVIHKCNDLLSPYNESSTTNETAN